MKEIIETLVVNLQGIVQNSSFVVSIFVGMFAIVLESIIPILPLALFIAVNMVAFGNIVGFVISWFATIIGCSISFFFCRKIHVKNETIQKLILKIDQMKFTSLVILLSIPFTPAFSVNIGAGLSHMLYRKYLCALIIAKVFIIYFWGFIGTTIIESITDIGILIKLGTMMIVAFILSKVVMHHLELE